MLDMSIMCEFAHYMKCRHLVNLLPLDNAVLKLNGLLTLILTYDAYNDLNQ